MAQVHATPQTTLRLTRTFAAPRGKVFRAWTDPGEVRRWFCPPGYETPSAAIDLRVGGQYRVGMREVVLTHELFPDEKARGEHERGWNGGLDNLAKIL